MYAWIWRHLPGGLPGRVAGSLVLLGGALALLFFVVFPYVEPRLPWNDVTVTGTPAPRTPGPSPTGTTSVPPTGGPSTLPAP